MPNNNLTLNAAKPWQGQLQARGDPDLRDVSETVLLGLAAQEQEVCQLRSEGRCTHDAKKKRLCCNRISDLLFDARLPHPGLCRSLLSNLPKSPPSAQATNAPYASTPSCHKSQEATSARRGSSAAAIAATDAPGPLESTFWQFESAPRMIHGSRVSDHGNC